MILKDMRGGAVSASIAPSSGGLGRNSSYIIGSNLTNISNGDNSFSSN